VTTFVERQAIDFHVHVHTTDGDGPDIDTDDLRQAAREYFGQRERPSASPKGIAEYYRSRNLSCVVFPVDSETVDGKPPVPNEAVAEFAADNGDVMLPFASVDPWKGAIARKAAKRLIEQHGARGFKFHPSTQAFQPNDQRFYPLYQILSDAQVTALFHTGQTGIGAGLPGGSGIKLRYSNPMYLDDVAADFPDLTIIAAHPSVPWQEEGLAVALHKRNVYIDLSGWSPKYFEPKLVQYMKRLIPHKFLFGSDYPLLEPDRWLRDFEGLELPDEVRQQVLKGNALQVLGLEPGG
jgi:uncharacterized protein